METPSKTMILENQTLLIIIVRSRLLSTDFYSSYSLILLLMISPNITVLQNPINLLYMSLSLIVLENQLLTIICRGYGSHLPDNKASIIQSKNEVNNNNQLPNPRRIHPLESPVSRFYYLVLRNVFGAYFFLFISIITSWIFCQPFK